MMEISVFDIFLLFVTSTYARALQRERCFFGEAMGEIIDVSTKNDLHSGAIERGVVVFSWVMFVPRDLDSGGVSRRGGNHPTRAFFSSGSASVFRLWLPPHFVAAR